MKKTGETIPEPIASKNYRVPPEVHRQLAIEAAESGVSINRIVSAKLSQR
jgi:predicted HicB family RNase H-like nuclease